MHINIAAIVLLTTFAMMIHIWPGNNVITVTGTFCHVMPGHHFSKDLIKLTVITFGFKAHSGVPLKQYRSNQIQFICQFVTVMMIMEYHPVTIIRADKLISPAIAEPDTAVFLQARLQIPLFSYTGVPPGSQSITQRSAVVVRDLSLRRSR